MRVLIPSALQSYTGGSWVQADGTTLAAVLENLDRRYPGIRFRMIDERGEIRRHMRFFFAGEPLSDFSQPLAPDGELVIAQALSGG